MPFDFDSLMNNPQFQFGLGLMGSASPRNAPLLQAYKMLQETKKMKQEEDYRKAQAEFMAAQTAQLTRKNSLQEGMQQQGMELLRQLLGPKGGGAAAPQPPVADPTVQPTAAVPEVGKYGTPKALLKNLMQVESSGNPYAVGPDIGGGVRALGPYQFLPSTISMLEKKGYKKFNPFDPAQAEEAADFYLQDLLKEHGGDWNKAVAAYGGFKSKDPSAYVSKVLAGSPEKITQQQSQLSAQAEQYKKVQQAAGVIRFMGGDVGGLSDVASSFKPDYEGERVGIERQRLDISREEAATRRAEELRKQREAGVKESGQFAKDKAAYSSVSSAADRMEEAANNLLKHPGLKSITGFSAITNPLAVPGSQAYGALADLKSLTAKLVNDTLQAIREASANGASGYGQFTEKELKVVEQYVASLDPGKPDFTDSLNRVVKYAQEIKNRSASLYEESTGKSAVEGLPKGARKIGTSGGKSVYQLPDGSRVMEK